VIPRSVTDSAKSARYVERMTNAATHSERPKYDVSQHASEGGKASGIARKFGRRNKALDRALESRNGAALIKAAEMEERRTKQRWDAKLRGQQQAERERARADYKLDDLTEQILEAEAELAELDKQHAELERLIAAIHLPENLAKLMTRAGDAATLAALELAGHDFVDEEQIDAAA